MHGSSARPGRHSQTVASTREALAVAWCEANAVGVAGFLGAATDAAAPLLQPSAKATPAAARQRVARRRASVSRSRFSRSRFLWPVSLTVLIATPPIRQPSCI